MRSNHVSEDKPEKIADLLPKIRACRACEAFLPLGARPVIQASGRARLVVAGQAPGTRVHASGIPFDDPSGDRLRDWMGVGPETFYDPCKINIIPMGFCYPGRAPQGGDLPPRKECQHLWHGRLFDALPQQSLIIVVGAYAHKYHLGQSVKRSVTETVMSWREYLPRYLPIPHPSPRNTLWLRRNPWFEKNVVPYLRLKVAQILGEHPATLKHLGE